VLQVALPALFYQVTVLHVNKDYSCIIMHAIQTAPQLQVHILIMYYQNVANVHQIVQHAMDLNRINVVLVLQLIFHGVVFALKIFHHVK